MGDWGPDGAAARYEFGQVVVRSNPDGLFMFVKPASNSWAQSGVLRITFRYSSAPPASELFLLLSLP